jgi:hypothetical protein
VQSEIEEMSKNVRRDVISNQVLREKLPCKGDI